jgi:hypothetical protein
VFADLRTSKMPGALRPGSRSVKGVRHRAPDVAIVAGEHGGYGTPIETTPRPSQPRGTHGADVRLRAKKALRNVRTELGSDIRRRQEAEIRPPAPGAAGPSPKREPERGASRRRGSQGPGRARPGAPPHELLRQPEALSSLGTRRTRGARIASRVAGQLRSAGAQASRTSSAGQRRRAGGAGRGSWASCRAHGQDPVGSSGATGGAVARMRAAGAG